MAWNFSLQTYHGEAVNPWNLSIFERWIGHHNTYDRARDEQDRCAFPVLLPDSLALQYPGHLPIALQLADSYL